MDATEATVAANECGFTTPRAAPKLAATAVCFSVLLAAAAWMVREPSMLGPKPYVLAGLVGLVTGSIVRRCRRRSPRRGSGIGRLGPYRIMRLLCSGGMGDLYLARHSLLQRPCVIKMVRPELAGDAIHRARFEREIQLAARLTHPNIVSIYDMGLLPQGGVYYVMEYLQGQNLQELVDRDGPMPLDRVLDFGIQIAAGLDFSHRQRMIHRDLKPANVMVVPAIDRELAKLVDFGLVKQLDAASDLTISGRVTGSPHYLSPEQASGSQPADERSDIYSFGALLCFLVTGRPPFCQEQTLQLLLAHVHQPPPALFPRRAPGSSRFGRELHEADVCRQLERLIHRCLAKDPTERYQDVADVAHELEQLRSRAS